MFFEQWLRESCFKSPTPEAKELARSAWRQAEHNVSIEEVNIAIKLTEASYQSKRAKLKKQITHWIGKFMIVKAENNRLRSINTAIIKRNKELQEYMMKLEVKEYVEILARTGEPYPGTALNKPTQELEESKHKKVPIQC